MTETLYTPRGEILAADPQKTPWESYPRPQLRRDSYVNLNGMWDFEVTASGLPREFTKAIRVPFCPESPLSGIGTHFPEGSVLCYRRRFTLPEGFRKERVLLHIGAADQQLTCRLNGREIGSHTGGYEAMTFDITDALQEENELVLLCRDDLRQQQFPYGKQTMKRGGMWYTPVSGIWQTVWLESVPREHIRALHIACRENAVTVTTEPPLDGTVHVDGLGDFLLVDGSVRIAPEQPRLWSPEDPYLYTFTVETARDRVESYFALRTVSIETHGGCPRLCLNGKPRFFHGLLDQGYWPDGLFTPAAPECYAEEIAAMKALGFNTLRKHIKVEAEEFYYQCDKQGMLVFQDMINNGDYNFLRDTALPTVGLQKRSDTRLHRDEATRRCFLSTMAATVRQLKNHPCILYWTIFNEAWGQFDSSNVYDLLRQMDDTRFIDTTSGWFRGSRTDVDSRHIYFSPWSTLQKSDKPLVLSEFGGFCCREDGHVFHPDKAYGYRVCSDRAHLQKALLELYQQKVVPAIARGLCAAVYTQVSDVEDEINGLLTYDRKICKVSKDAMNTISQSLYTAFAAATADGPEGHTVP